MVCQLKELISTSVDKIQNPLKFVILGGCSIKLGHEAYLIARDLAIAVSSLSLDMLSKKSLESPKTEVSRSFCVLLPQLYLFASLGLGAAILVKASYDYAKKSFKTKDSQEIQEFKPDREPQLILDIKND